MRKYNRLVTLPLIAFLTTLVPAVAILGFGDSKPTLAAEDVDFNTGEVEDVPPPADVIHKLTPDEMNAHAKLRGEIYSLEVALNELNDPSEQRARYLVEKLIAEKRWEILDIYREARARG